MYCWQCGLGEFNAADGSGITRAQPCVWVPRHVPGTGSSFTSASSPFHASFATPRRENDRRSTRSNYDGRSAATDGEELSSSDAATGVFRGPVSMIAAGGQTSLVVLASPNALLQSPTPPLPPLSALSMPNVATIAKPSSGSGAGAGARNIASTTTLSHAYLQSWPGLQPPQRGACSVCHGMGGVWCWGMVPASSSHRAPSQASPLNLHKLSAATACQCAVAATTTCKHTTISGESTKTVDNTLKKSTASQSDSMHSPATSAGSATPNLERPSAVRAVHVGGGGRHVVCVLGSSTAAAARGSALL